MTLEKRVHKIKQKRENVRRKNLSDPWWKAHQTLPFLAHLVGLFSRWFDLLPSERAWFPESLERFALYMTIGQPDTYTCILFTCVEECLKKKGARCALAIITLHAREKLEK